MKEAMIGTRATDLARRATSLYSEIARALTGTQEQEASGTLEQLLRARVAQDMASSIAGAISYGWLAHAGIFAPSLALH